MVDFVASGIAAIDRLQLVKLQMAIYKLEVPFAAKPLAALALYTIDTSMLMVVKKLLRYYPFLSKVGSSLSPLPDCDNMSIN